MSIAALMNQTITFHRTTTTARDAIGGSGMATEATLTVDCYLEPTLGETDSREDMADRNTQIGDWRAFVAAGTDVDGWDRATSGDYTFDVLGPPRPITNGRTGTVHHLQVELREVV